tara:strand:- start:1344 stop:1460 length:117 start_codon:yes stop_codon:yes gene_type:complete
MKKTEIYFDEESDFLEGISGQMISGKVGIGRFKNNHII